LGDEMVSINENVLISKLLGRDVISLNEDNTIYDAINLLAKNKIGALPIVKNQKILCGIISERDIIRELAKDIKKNLKKSLVSTIMTSKVITCNKFTKSDELMDIMTVNKIRHIPIIEGENLIGIISIGDVVKRLIEKFNLENDYLKSWLY
jgi:CBS domain-containing protein|tara:strand:+ start:215 stop:667 length:453 start_codon:yes stop_codon:yes gene_type:complete